MRILLVDDNQDSLRGLSVVLTDLGHEPTALTSAEDALAVTDTDYYPMIITDIRMPGMDGLTLLRELKERAGSSRSDVVLITGHGDMETAINALRGGAYDYLNKPINARELAAVVERSAEHQMLLTENIEYKTSFTKKVEQEVTARSEALKRDLEQARQKLKQVAGIGHVVVTSEAMRSLFAECDLYHADPEVPVLIEGETGTGKEIVARYIHFGRGAESSAETFVALNCSAIPQHLFESELFGHEAGAYTGSTRSGSQGKLELAADGTLFLDEVAEMPLELQPKLLRVLEERAFYRLGGVKRRHFRARVVCAANRDLGRLVEEGAFRRDLYHRLKVGHVRIPPLRERPEEILPLTEHFLTREAKRKKKHFAAVSGEAAEFLARQPWQGNVRELENVIERAVLTCDGEVLERSHLAFLLDEVSRAGDTSAAIHGVPVLGIAGGQAAFSLPEDGLDVEQLYDTILRKALEKFGGNKTRAAKYLGISRYALHRRLSQPEPSRDEEPTD